jgi:hypothetical protein
LWLLWLEGTKVRLGGVGTRGAIRYLCGFSVIRDIRGVAESGTSKKVSKADPVCWVDEEGKGLEITSSGVLQLGTLFTKKVAVS